MLNQRGFNPLIIVLIVSLIGSLVLGSYFMLKKKTSSQYSTQTLLSSPSPQSDESKDKSGPVNQIGIKPDTSSKSASYEAKSKYDITLPSNMQVADNFYGQSFILVRTKDEIRKFYKDVTSGKVDCTGPCSDMVGKPKVLEKQLEILEKAYYSKNCQFPNSLKDEIAKEFILFAQASEEKYAIKGIYLPNLEVCGLSYIASDGYDVNTANFKYKVGFMKNDQVVEINWELFPTGVFKEVDELWTSFGRTNDGLCEDECTEKDTQYFINFKASDPVVQIVSQAYEQSVKSFKLK